MGFEFNLSSHVSVVGDQTSPAIVFLHGFGDFEARSRPELSVSAGGGRKSKTLAFSLERCRRKAALARKTPEVSQNETSVNIAFPEQRKSVRVLQ